MSQRSYSNERYRKGAEIGSTRKSAASAKPVRKQGSVETASKSASKSTSKSAAKGTPKGTSDGIEKDWAGLPTSPEIKKWRRVWWVLLLAGIAAVALGYLVPELRANEDIQRAIAIGVLAASMTAVTIDLVVIRRLRKELIESLGKKPSKKEQKHADGADTSGKGEA